jgi:hypothetical protein
MRRIESFSHLGHRGHKIVGPLHGVEAGTHRDHHMIGSPQGIDGEYPQGGRSIEKDEVINAELLGIEKIAKPLIGIDLTQEPSSPRGTRRGSPGEGPDRLLM